MTIATYKASCSEKALQDSIIDAAQRMGYLVAHVNDSRGQMTNGLPDLIIVGKQKVIFAELKTQRGKLSPTQEVWRNVLSQSSHSEYHLVRPDQCEDGLSMDELLERLGD